MRPFVRALSSLSSLSSSSSSSPLSPPPPPHYNNSLFSPSQSLSFSRSQFHSHSQERETKDFSKWGAIAVGTTLTSLSLFHFLNNNQSNFLQAEQEECNPEKKDCHHCKEKEKEEKEVPIYRMEEVKEHKTREKGIWVIFRGNIYDISTFLDGHPGGKEKILLAAGGDVEDFWEGYPIHYDNEAVKEVLADRLVGRLHPQDLAPPKKDTKDPFSNDPRRSKALNALVTRPFNAETPSLLIPDNYITPNALWFVRNHHPVPEIDPSSFSVSVSTSEDLGRGETRSLSLSLDALKKRKAKKIVASIQCTGNRRRELTLLERTMGQPWSVGGISTAEFEGVPIRDLLSSIGIKEGSLKGAKHVHFYGGDEPFASSIPIEKAISKDGDVILAYSMNGSHIPRDHGFPLRVIVPGFAGVRSVKWVNKIVVSSQEAPGAWTRGMSYKFFPHWIKDLDGIDMDKQFSVQELPVTSCICSVNDGLPVEKTDDEVGVKGFAYSGGGKSIVSVQVSPDSGKTWYPAQLAQGKEQVPGKAWAWTFWECDLPIPKDSKEKGELSLVVRAIDSSFNSQPERLELCWNIRGILNNAWHRLSVPIVEEEEEEEEE